MAKNSFQKKLDMLNRTIKESSSREMNSGIVRMINVSAVAEYFLRKPDPEKLYEIEIELDELLNSQRDNHGKRNASAPELTSPCIDPEKNNFKNIHKKKFKKR